MGTVYHKMRIQCGKYYGAGENMFLVKLNCGLRTSCSEHMGG
jgi:hypothetical protein